jgi:hypothetical protein
MLSVADEPLVAVGELLPAHLERDRELLEVPDQEIGHLQLERAVVLGQVLSGRRRRVPVIAYRVARPRLDDERDQVPLVGDARHEPGQPVVVAVVGRGIREEVEVRAGMGRSGVLLVLVSKPLVYPEVPALQVREFGDQIGVDHARHGRRRRRRDVLRARGGGAEEEHQGLGGGSHGRVCSITGCQPGRRPRLVGYFSEKTGLGLRVRNPAPFLWG